MFVSVVAQEVLPNNTVSALANDILNIILIRNVERNLPRTSRLGCLSLLSHCVVKL
jgi:hypothetical protein